MEIIPSTRTSTFIHHGFVCRWRLGLNRLLRHASIITSSTERFSRPHPSTLSIRPASQGVCLHCRSHSTQRTPHSKYVSHDVFPVRFISLICRVDKPAYPHFDIYPSWVQVLVPLAQDVPRPKKACKSHKELHDEVPPCLPTTPDVLEDPPSTDRASRRLRRLTIVAKQQEPVERLPLPLVPKVSPLRRRVSSLNQLNGQSSSPSRPRVSPVFDRFPSIETRLSQSDDEAAEPLDKVPTALTRSKSLSAKPTTPKRRQSALIAQRIKALSATIESPEPDFDRPVRRSIRSLPISPTRT